MYSNSQIKGSIFYLHKCHLFGRSEILELRISLPKAQKVFEKFFYLFPIKLSRKKGRKNNNNFNELNRLMNFNTLSLFMYSFISFLSIFSSLLADAWDGSISKILRRHNSASSYSNSSLKHYNLYII